MAVGSGLARHEAATSEIQRTRILDAVTRVVAERGLSDTSVRSVIEQAAVSRRTFYECFGGLEACLVVIMNRTLGRVGALAVDAFEAGPSWQDGMRSALAQILVFFDSEPELARVCIVEMLAGGPLLLAERERVMKAFRELLLAKAQSAAPHTSPLAAEGLLASVMGIVHARLVAHEQRPLIELLGPLMGLLTAPYLEAPEVEREIERGNELAREMREHRSPHISPRLDLPGNVPNALLSPRAHRARLSLLYVAEHPGASNQQVANGIGASHRGQVSQLLGRLAALGLLAKCAAGPGHPNAWSLTTAGEQVVLTLYSYQSRRSPNETP